MAKKKTNPKEAAVPNVHWDDSQMATSFANVVNVSSTREEVTVFFGTNQSWKTAGESDVTVQLSNRVILTPFGAKRLWMLLGGLLKEYETRYGALEITVSGSAGGSA